MRQCAKLEIKIVERGDLRAGDDILDGGRSALEHGVVAQRRHLAHCFGDRISWRHVCDVVAEHLFCDQILNQQANCFALSVAVIHQDKALRLHNACAFACAARQRNGGGGEVFRFGVDTGNAVEAPALVIIHGELTQCEQVSQVFELRVLGVVAFLIKGFEHLKRLFKLGCAGAELAVGGEHGSTKVVNQTVERGTGYRNRSGGLTERIDLVAVSALELGELLCHNEHFGRLVEEMDKIAYAKGYLISLMANRNSEDFVSQVISRQPDGIIVSSVSFQEKYLQMLVDSGVPVVIIGNRMYENLDRRVGVVSPGVLEGICENVNLLARKGCKNMIYLDRISANGNFSGMSDLRYRGFCEQMQRIGLPFSKDSIFSGYSSEEELQAALVHRLKSGARIDGVVARNDNLATVAMSAAAECGLRIPQDIAVVGFDNSRISMLTSPKLTTMQIDRAGMARGIITMMDSMLAGNAPSVEEFRTTLIEREST